METSNDKIIEAEDRVRVITTNGYGGHGRSFSGVCKGWTPRGLCRVVEDETNKERAYTSDKVRLIKKAEKKAEKKKYQGLKELSALSKSARALGLHVSTKQYNKGTDHIRLYQYRKDVNIDIILSMVNGRFFGTYNGTAFDSNNTDCDGLSWFNELLDTFYLPAL